MDIEQKKLNIVIFGAAGSIGNYLARKYYNLGHNLFLTVKNKKHEKKIKNEFLKKEKQNISIKIFNYQNENVLKKFIFKNKIFFKNVDLLINCLGEQGEIKNFFKVNLKKFLKTIDINFLFNVYLIKFLYPLIKDKKKLLIIFFSGGGSLSFRENFSSYSISKTSLIKFTEIISKEFRNKNIRTNIIAPGIIDSKMTKKIINLKNKSLIKNEVKRIKKFIEKSDKTKEKIYLTINFLNSKKGKNISGKIISSMWDNPMQWSRIKIKKIMDNQFYTLNRKIEKNGKNY